MKKAYKITWISLASLFGVIIIVIGIALYLLLDSDRLTSLVNKYGSDFITCDYNFGKVDMTLFKTFPDVGVEINDLVLLNPTEGCDNDTLAVIDKCLVSVNIKKLLFSDEIIINTCELDGGYINVFFDKEGKSNIEIFPPSEPEPVTTAEESSTSINLDKLSLRNVRINYTDLAGNTFAAIDGLSMDMTGDITDEAIAGTMTLTIKDLLAEINDSSMMRLATDQLVIDGKLEIKGDNIVTNANVSAGKLAFLLDDEEPMDVDMKDFSFNYDGSINNYEYIKGLINFAVADATVTLDHDNYVSNATLSLNSPIECDINRFAIMMNKMSSSMNIPLNVSNNKGNARLSGSTIGYNNISIDLSGEIAMNEDISMNLDMKTNTFNIPDLIAIIPESMREDIVGGITADGSMTLNSHIEGVLNDETLPVVSADVVLKDGFIMMKDELPYPVTNINTVAHANIDMNNKSDLKLTSFKAKMNNSTFDVSGNVNDVLDKMLCNLNIKTNLYFSDVKSFLPDEIAAAGNMKANVNFKGTLEQLENLDLMHTKINGNLYCKNLDLNYYDSDTVSLASSAMQVDFVIPNPASNALKDGLAQIKINGSDIDAEVTGAMKALLDGFNIDAQISNVLDENNMMAVLADYDIKKVDMNIVDARLRSDNALGSAFILPSANEGNISYTAVYSSDSVTFTMGDDLAFAAEAVVFNSSTEYDEREEDILLQWDPTLDLDMSNAVIASSSLKEKIFIPDISLSYTDEGLLIDNSQIVLGNSDFSLKGTLTNIYNHFKDKELLKGDFTFTSGYTDVNELMDIVNGMGAEEELTVENTETDTIASEDDPFIVPYGVDITLHTHIKNATAGKMDIRNVGGDLTVKDGILVLQEMGFTSEAAKMQLTAIYKSKRMNHLYVGFDFHLLDIDIAEMIRIIPDLDTIVPMLKNFAGNAEFHFAAETNLKSDYSVKYSTLKAACSIEGSDLVVLDSETFNKIKKLLLFNRNTDNKIDSLDVQFTVFKNEIDVYPFAVTMDKYSAMLYGRHNLDMSYDYRIEVLSPAILNRLGLEIKGPDLDNMKFKVRRTRHRNMFKPEKRDYKEEKVAEIKKIISNSLKENVKP